MKKFLKRIGRIFILALVFIFAAAPALADVGMNVRQSLSLAAGQNVFYGYMMSTSDPGASLIKLQTYNGSLWSDKFKVDGSGNVAASGNVAGSQLCIGADCRNVWPSGGTSQWVTNVNNIYYNTGNVGIGTANPAAIIHAYNPSVTAGDLEVGRFEAPNAIAANEQQYLTVGNTANGGYIAYMQSNTSLGLGLHGAATVINIKGGNVGIGTAAPGTKLDVVGVITAFEGNSSNWNTAYSIVNGATSANTSGAIVRRDASGNFSAGTITANVIGNVTGTVSGNANTASALAADGSNCAAGNYPLGVDASGNVQNCTAASGGGLGGSGTANYVSKFTAGTTLGDSIIYDNGANVGIGTAVPSAKLSLYGVNNVNTPMFEIFTRQAGSPSFQRIAYIGPTGSNINDGYFQLSDAGTVRVNIAANNSRGGDTYFNGGGNVGIGITNPNSRLHVYNTSANSEIDIQSVAGAGNHWGIYSNNSDNSYRVWGGGDFLTILRGGNVGIGTNAPGTKLDVAGVITATGGNSTNWNTAYTGVNGATSANTAGAIVRRDASGNFSAGTVTANVIGNVTGTVSGNAGTASALAADGSNCAAGNYPLGVDASGNAQNCTAAASGGIGGSGSAQYLAVFTGSNTIGNSTIIDNGVTVGIGTLPTSARLEVLGSIHSSNGSGYGVQGVGSNYGVQGTGGAVSTAGVYGDGPNTGVWGQGGNYGVHGVGSVRGIDGSSVDTAVYGNGGIYGVRGEGANVGVYGNASSRGVQANSAGTAFYATGGNYDFYAAGGVPNYFSGRVGIGVINPNANLDVVGTIRLNPGTTPVRGMVLASLDALGRADWTSTLNGSLSLAAGNNIFSAPFITLNGSSAPILRFNNTSATANNQTWSMTQYPGGGSAPYNSNALILKVEPDGGAWEWQPSKFALEFYRSGQSIGDVVMQNGNVTIGADKSSNGGYKLYVAGDAYTTGTWAGSDIRWKKDITPLKDSLNKVLNLQGVNYQWNIKDYPKMGFTAGKQIGLIARDTEKVIPELVNTDNKGYKSISYEKLAAVLVEAMKEQQKRIEELEAKINRLEKVK